MITIAYVLLCLIWGSTWMFIKIGLEHFSPLTFAALRFVLTAAVMFITLTASGKLKSLRELYSWPAIAFGFFNGIAYALVFEGENRITSSLTAVLNSVLPFFTLVLAAVFVNERITLRKAIGLSLGFSGILYLYWNDLSKTTPEMVLGGAMVILSALAYSSGSVITKKFKTDLGIMQTVTTQMSVSGLVLLVLAAVLEKNHQVAWNYESIIALAYLTIVGSALAFILNYYLIKNMEVSRLSYVSMITPIIAVVFGVIFLNEPFNMSFLWTLLSVLTGMYIIST